MKENKKIEIGNKKAEDKLSTNFSDPENLARYFENSLRTIMDKGLEIEEGFLSEKNKSLVRGMISRANELCEFADIITDYHSDEDVSNALELSHHEMVKNTKFYSKLKELEDTKKYEPDTTDHKIQANRLGENIFYALKDFNRVLNNYEILGVIEIVKAKFIHDLSKIADAKDIVMKEKKAER